MHLFEVEPDRCTDENETDRLTTTIVRSSETRFVFLNQHLSTHFSYFKKLRILKSDSYSIFSNKLSVSSRENRTFPMSVRRYCDGWWMMLMMFENFLPFWYPDAGVPYWAIQGQCTGTTRQFRVNNEEVGKHNVNGSLFSESQTKIWKTVS